jgi:hypothetical protein
VKWFMCSVIFFECCAKVDGEWYPTYTLKGLYRSFNCILQRHQEKRVSISDIDETTFNLDTFAAYKDVGIACVLSMEKSQESRVNKPRKKAEVVSFEIEVFILQHACTQPTCARNLQYRVFFYLEFCSQIEEARSCTK